MKCGRREGILENLSDWADAAPVATKIVVGDSRHFEASGLDRKKAWSQNLGHENVLTTFSSYGDVARHRQAEIIRGLGKSESLHPAGGAIN